MAEKFFSRLPFGNRLQNNSDDFNSAIAVSVGLHLALIIFFVMKSTLSTKPVIDLSQAISVSLADLPQTTEKLPAKAQPVAAQPEPAPETVAEPEPVAKPIPTPVPPKSVTAPKRVEKTPPQVTEKQKPAEEINLKKSKQKQKAALDKIKKLSALDQIKQDVKTDAVKSLSKPQIKPANRVIAAGTTLGGLEKIEAAEYLQQLDAQIKQAWTLPQWLKNQPLQTQVLVKFNVNGQILSTEVIKSSGNRTYDSYCLQAVQKASPFPQVPLKFSDKFSVDGLVIGFPE